jgi:hypothetical protein
MLARAAFSVIRRFKLKKEWVATPYMAYERIAPARARAERYIDFVRRQNWIILEEEAARDDRIRFGMESDS